MPYRFQVIGNYLTVVDTATPDLDIVSEHTVDIRVERAGTFVNLYSKSTKRYLPSQNFFTVANSVDAGDNPFADIDALLLFLRQSTGLGFSTPAGGSAGLSEANIFTEDNTFLGNIEAVGSCIAEIGSFGTFTAVELATPPTTAQLDELQWQVFIVSGEARLYINIGGTIFASAGFS